MNHNIMRWKKIIIAITSILISACSSNLVPPNPYFYDSKTLHFLNFESDISLTSIFISNDLNEHTRKNVKTNSIIEIAKVSKNWLNAAFFISKDIELCIASQNNIKENVEKIFADNLLSKSKYLFNVYILKRQNFKFKSYITPNNELSMYFALDECTTKGVKDTFLTIRNQLVHELSHLALYDNKSVINTTDRKEEEYAHTLEVCNALYSKAFTKINFNQNFNQVYEDEAISKRNSKYSKAEKNSELGKIDAHIRAQKISNKFIQLKQTHEKEYYKEFRKQYCNPIIKVFNSN